MMSRSTRRFFLSLIVVVLALMAIVFVRDISIARDPRRPAEPRALAAWLARHPADWIAASALSDSVLDSSLPRRFEIWRAAHDIAQQLAPLRPNATAAFVRGGLFHWYELSPADRKAVLDEAATLLRDEGVFGNLHQPLWQLTRDYAYLRRHVPDSLNALDQLRRLAAQAGLFAEYREARDAMQRKRFEIFQRDRSTLTIDELLQLARDPGTADDRLLRGILEELHRRSFDPAELIGHEPLVVYALNHELQPLEGLAPLINEPGALTAPTRARLALALNNPGAAKGIEISSTNTASEEWLPYRIERGQVNEIGEQPWRNTCSGNELCDSVAKYATAASGAIPIALSPSQTDETPPYVEIYVDDALVAEGEVADTRTFNVPASDGVHRVEIRLINRLTKNGIQRRVRLS